MPNKNTFEIPEVIALIRKYTNDAKVIINPFCGKTGIGTHTNDLNPGILADEHLDAIDYLRNQPSDFADMLLNDPPFSQRQAKEAYNSFGLENLAKNSSWFTDIKKEIARIVKPGGIVITCGWNSGGIGKKNGFQIIDGLLICHGAAHNDTVVTVERKVPA